MLAQGNGLYINGATSTFNINRAINKSIFNENAKDYNRVNRERKKMINDSE